MASRVLRQLARAAVLIGAVGLTVVSSLEATRPVRRTTRPGVARGFNLFAGQVNVVMNANRVQCNVNTIGETCVDPTNSPTIPGGFWPKGSPNQYIFNGGLQIAGIVGGTDAANFPWPGDTVGAFFFDPRGDQAHGEGRTNVFNSLAPEDLAEWPTAAYIRDTSLFNDALIGRKTVSQQDTWVRYWDGNTNLQAGRAHPMGLLVEQRGLMWNFPSGNQDIVYFLYRFINITSIQASSYAGLVNAGYAPSDINDIVAIAQEFQQRAEATYNVSIPDTGYAFTNLYASFAQDPDVGTDAGINYANANLIYALGFAYQRNFNGPGLLYPPDINGPPFHAGPGFVGTKYLKSPQNIGIAMFGNTTNGGAFPDRVGVQALWRLLSGRLLPQDGSCTVPEPQNRHICYVAQAAADARFFQSSGPFSLNPGESAVIVVAYVHAAPLASAPAATPGFGPALAAFTLPTASASDLKPGIPISSNRLYLGLDTVRQVDRAMGWLNHFNPNGDTLVTQDEVVTQPRSLLNKAMVAQAVFDNRFLLPFAPEAPTFYLVPGDNQVNVVWQPSSSETDGDPFFAVASNVASPLYDPNFRQYDVEGYRVWRGRTQATMEVVASFDYAGTVITDYTGAFWNEDDYGARCAPELGITTTCPANFGGGGSFDIPLVGLVRQIPPGGRVALTTGDVLNTIIDTAVVGGGSGLPDLVDNRVPFAWADTDVRNGFRYFYAVTAFDVNSVKSGPTSLESVLSTRSVTPRASGSNRVASTLSVSLVGGNGAVLNPDAPFPTIDPVTGTLSGPAPPSNALRGTAFVASEQLVIPGSTDFIIDSVVPEWYHSATFYVTATNGTVTTQYVLYSGQDHGPLGQNDGDLIFDPLGMQLRADSNRADSLNVDALPFAGFAQSVLRMHPPVWGSQHADWNPDVAGSFWSSPSTFSRDGGSRWFDGANETMADPTLGLLHGQLTGVTTIYRPVRVQNASNLFRRFDQTNYYANRAADMKVYWGATPGRPDSVVDVTHRLPVPFQGQYRASYGFLPDFNGSAEAISPPNGILTYQDYLFGACLPFAAAVAQTGCTGRNLVNTAILMPVDVTGDQVADGNGFGMYIAGEPFIFLTNTLPTNTVWTLRTYMGEVKRTGGAYSYVGRPSNAGVPGLTMRVSVGQAGSFPDATADLANVHTVPDPYYVTNALEISANTKVLRFVNLPHRAIIRIYSASGILVNVLNHNDPTGGGETTWNLRNRNNQFVASGVYFYHVEAANGQTKVGRFTVVNFAQ
jgi:hypothetical protein